MFSQYVLIVKNGCKNGACATKYLSKYVRWVSKNVWLNFQAWLVRVTLNAASRFALKNRGFMGGWLAGSSADAGRPVSSWPACCHIIFDGPFRMVRQLYSLTDKTCFHWPRKLHSSHRICFKKCTCNKLRTSRDHHYAECLLTAFNKHSEIKWSVSVPVYPSRRYYGVYDTTDDLSQIPKYCFKWICGILW